MNTKTRTEKALEVYGNSAEDIYVRFMEDYVRRLEPDSRSAYSELFRQLALEPGQRVLEVGIGTGRNIHRYPENVSLVGIDLTPEMLEEAIPQNLLLVASGCPLASVATSANFTCLYFAL